MAAATRTTTHATRKLTRPADIDEIIVSLADAYENKRARQVSEWVVRQRSKGNFAV